LLLVKGVKRPKDGFFLRAESFFNLGTDIERMDAEIADAPLIIDSYGGRSLHEQSHGESFFALMMNRFGGHGFYVLDEPEAELSPSRQLAMITRMHQPCSRAHSSSSQLIHQFSWHTHTHGFIRSPRKA
jgi:predicted ATPase